MNASLFILAAENSEFSLGKIAFQVGAVFFFVLLNGFFVASEFALVKVRSSQLDALVAKGNRRAEFARRMIRNLDAYLSATQLGIAVSSIILGMLGEPFVARLFQPLFEAAVGSGHDTILHQVSLVIAFVLITFLHVVLGEMAPKSLAIHRALPATLWLARPLHCFYVLFKPAIWMLNGTANALLRMVFRIDLVHEAGHSHSPEELRLIVTASEKDAHFTETERDILINALELNELVVRDIMTPRSEVASLDPTDPFDENLRTARESPFTRFPLVKGHLDTTIGLVHIKDILRLIGTKAPDLLKIKKPIQAVPEMMPLDRLLKHFLSQNSHLAIVVDEYGGTVGVVSLEDVLEELVGEIHDEFDTVQSGIVRISDHEYLVEGSLALYELEDHIGLEWEDPEVSTVGGYVTHRFGHLPDANESIRIGDYNVSVEKADGRRIVQLRFRKNGEGESETAVPVSAPSSAQS